MCPSVENGATEDEALAAATKAHELLERYQLEIIHSRSAR